jgi:hypothetical protein
MQASTDQGDHEAGGDDRQIPQKVLATIIV